MRRPPVVAPLLLFAATTAAAQSPANDWSPVRQLPPGQPVRVLTDAAIAQAGTLTSVADDSVTGATMGGRAASENGLAFGLPESAVRRSAPGERDNPRVVAGRHDLDRHRTRRHSDQAV